MMQGAHEVFPNSAVLHKFTQGCIYLFMVTPEKGNLGLDIPCGIYSGFIWT